MLAYTRFLKIASSGGGSLAGGRKGGGAGLERAHVFNAAYAELV